MGSVSNSRACLARRRATYHISSYKFHSLLAIILITVMVVLSTAMARTTKVVSANAAGEVGNNWSYFTKISTDGRYIVFDSMASNLVANDTNGVTDVFLYDQVTQVLERVSVASDGSEADGDSSLPVVSGDGRYVAFQSTATNLLGAGNDTNGVSDIFVVDRTTGTVERVSLNVDGGEAAGPSFRPSISDDGSIVAFESYGLGLDPADAAENNADIYLRDRVAGTTQWISKSFDGSQALAPGASHYPIVSADGSTVGFYSYSDNLVEGLVGGTRAYVYDLTTSTMEVVSVTSDGAPSFGYLSALSADGRYAAFMTSASGVVPGDTNGSNDLFLRDRVAGTTERISVGYDGSESNGITCWTHPCASFSSDARYIAFYSWATNLVPNDTNGWRDVFVRDLVTGTNERISVANNGEQVIHSSENPVMSGDGRYVVFVSYSAQLVDGDTNNQTDVFVHDRLGPTANAGPDQFVAIGADVQLDGSGSLPDEAGGPITGYAWAIESAPAGSTAELVGADTIAPSFTPDVIGTYTFSLVISDGSATEASDRVSIHVSSSYYQTHNYSWTRTVGGVVSDEGRAIATDNNGNIYYAGLFWGQVDLDPTTGVDLHGYVGMVNAYLTKLNPDGSYAWSRIMFGAGYNFGSGIAIADSGDVYVTGNYSGRINYDPYGGGDSHGVPGTTGTFLTKINADGSYGWTRITQTARYYGWGRTISVDSNQNIYLTGTYSDGANFDPEGAGDIRTAADNNDIFLTKINTDGSYGWTATMGSAGYDMGHSVIVDGSDNVYFTGHFQNTVDLDPTAGVDLRTSIDASVDVFLIKYNAAGVYQWTQTMGGSFWDGSYEIDADDAGNIFITGLFEGTSDLDPTAGIDNHTAIGAADIYVTKLNADGSYGWTRTLGEPSTFNNWGNYLTVAGDGTAYATGCFTGTRDFDFTDAGVDARVSAGNADIFVTQILNDGSYSWTKVMGGTEYDCSISAAVDNANNLFVTGLFNGTADFNSDGGGDLRTSAGGQDIFVTRFAPINPPVADAGVDQNIYLGDIAQLDGSASSTAGSTPVVSYAWTIESAPTGSVATLSANNVVNPTLEPDMVGDYLISLVVNDGSVDSVADDVVISVAENLSPVAQIITDIQTGDAPLTVNFSAATSSDPENAALTYAWDFGDPQSIDNTSAVVAPSHVYNTAGNYTAVVTVTDDYGNSDQAAVAIVVTAPNMPPTVNPSANPTSGVVPLDVQFSANATDPEGDVLTYSWDFGDGAFSDESNPAHVYTDAGTYTAVVTVSDGEFTVSGQVVIAVDSPLAIDVTEVRIEYGTYGQAEGKVKMEADFTYDATLDMTDEIRVSIDGVELLSVPFGSFSLDEPGEYEYQASNVHASIDLYENEIEVSRRNMILTGIDNRNGVDVVISFGNSTGTDHFVLETDDHDDDDHDYRDGYNNNERGEYTYKNPDK